MLRIGFVTCVQLGLSCMEAIYDVGGHLDFAMTLKDELAPRKSGRIYLDEFCSARQIPLSKVRNVNDADAIQSIVDADLDWLFIVGWSQIAHRSVLASTRNGALGMHPTLLPIGRGRAAIPWAIILDLPETGVTLFQLDDGVDTGPIVARHRVVVEHRETATTLYRKINQAHRSILMSHWRALISDELPLEPQNDSQASTWPGRKPEDGRLTYETSVFDADRIIRAVTRPYPGAFIDEPRIRIRVWATGSPFEDLVGSSACADQARRLFFNDGWLDACEWSVEPIECGLGF